MTHNPVSKFRMVTLPKSCTYHIASSCFEQWFMLRYVQLLKRFRMMDNPKEIEEGIRVRITDEYILDSAKLCELIVQEADKHAEKEGHVSWAQAKFADYKRYAVVIHFHRCCGYKPFFKKYALVQPTRTSGLDIELLK